MSNKPISIAISNTEWTAITSAGQSGTVWLQNKPTLGRIVISHSDSGSPAGLTIENSFSLPNKLHPSGILDIIANNIDDVFYARCTRGSGTLLVDAV